LIYFIQNINTGSVKIGYSRRIKERLSVLSVGSDSKLDIIKVLKVNNQVESVIFNKFSKDRIKGEWFAYSNNIKRFINDVPNVNTKQTIDFINDFKLDEILETTTKIEDPVPDLRVTNVLNTLDTAIIRSKNSGFTDGIRFAQHLIRQQLLRIKSS